MAKKKSRRNQTRQEPERRKQGPQETPKGFIAALGLGLLAIIVAIAVLSNRSAPTGDVLNVAGDDREDAAQVADNGDTNTAEKTADTAKKKDPAAKPAKSMDLLDTLATDAATFGGNADRAKAFAALKTEVETTKNIRKSKTSVDDFWKQAKGNPGGGDVAVLAAYTDLRARDPKAALSVIDEAQIANPGEQEDALGTLAYQAKLDLLPPNAMPPSDLIAGLDAHARSVDSPTLQAIDLYNLGRAYKAANQPDEALAQWESLAKSHPGSPETPKALYSAGRYYQSVGRAEEAVQAYDNIIKDYRSAPEYKYATREVKMLRIIGKPGQDVEVEEWLNGDPGTLAAGLDGKVVVYLFWASWCPHCRKEMPEVIDLYQKYKDQGLVVIGVTNIDKRQSREKLTDYVAENSVPFPIAVQSGRDASNYYAVSGIPAAAIVDRDGVIRWRNHPGQDLEGAIQKLLAKAT